MKYVILGSSAAGVNAAKEIRRVDTVSYTHLTLPTN